MNNSSDHFRCWECGSYCDFGICTNEHPDFSIKKAMLGGFVTIGRIKFSNAPNSHLWEDIYGDKSFSMLVRDGVCEYQMALPLRASRVDQQ